MLFKDTRDIWGSAWPITVQIFIYKYVCPWHYCPLSCLWPNSGRIFTCHI